MKPHCKHLSKKLASLLAFGVLLNGCATSGALKNSILIEPGMTKKEVTTIMGTPGDRQFKQSNEAWQYCGTDLSGFDSDDYRIVWFVDGKVTGVTTYKNRLFGACESHFRQIEWQEAPDMAVEVRKR